MAQPGGATDLSAASRNPGVRRMVAGRSSSSPRNRIYTCTRWMTSACGSCGHAFAPKVFSIEDVTDEEWDAFY